MVSDAIMLFVLNGAIYVMICRHTKCIQGVSGVGARYRAVAQNVSSHSGANLFCTVKPSFLRVYFIPHRLLHPISISSHFCLAWFSRFVCKSNMHVLDSSVHLVIPVQSIFPLVCVSYRSTVHCQSVESEPNWTHSTKLFNWMTSMAKGGE